MRYSYPRETSSPSVRFSAAFLQKLQLIVEESTASAVECFVTSEEEQRWHDLAIFMATALPLASAFMYLVVVTYGGLTHWGIPFLATLGGVVVGLDLSSDSIRASTAPDARGRRGFRLCGLSTSACTLGATNGSPQTRWRNGCDLC
jgi:hypothetical protein